MCAADPREHLIIDGYNVMHADEGLASLMKLDLEAARDTLVARLLDYASRQSVEVEVVFDAGGREGPAASERSGDYLKITYTARGQSADDYIERLMYMQRARHSGPYTVVTGDYAQQKVVSGAGMLRMSSREFLVRLSEASEAEKERADRRTSKADKVTLGDALDPLTRAALERFKQQRP